MTWQNDFEKMITLANSQKLTGNAEPKTEALHFPITGFFDGGKPLWRGLLKKSKNDSILEWIEDWEESLYRDH